MNQRAQAEKYAIISEINEINRELEQIASNLKRFQGIGTEHCTSKLYSISNKYEYIRNRLYHIR